MRRLCAVLAAGCFALAVPSAAGAAPAEGPALEVPERKLEAALHCPERFDDPDHEPVLLVHGTFATGKANWGWNYVPTLTADGWDVCTVDLPANSTIDAQVQAEYVVHAIRAIAARSGERVDVLGHSQGGLHPRWALKWWPDLRLAVDDYVMLASPNHGTLVAEGAVATGCFEACMQMRPSSNYLAALNAGDETPGDVSYTSLFTLTDVLVQPQVPESTSAIEGAVNVLVQEMCPGRVVDHTQMAVDAAVAVMVLDAFTHPGPFNPGRFDVSACLGTWMEGTDAETFLGLGDDYQFPFSETFRGDDEPPLKPYARGEAPASGPSEPTEAAGDTTGPSVAGAGSGGGEAPAPVSARPTPATGAPTTVLLAGGSGLVSAAWWLRRRVPAED